MSFWEILLVVFLLSMAPLLGVVVLITILASWRWALAVLVPVNLWAMWLVLDFYRNQNTIEDRMGMALFTGMMINAGVWSANVLYVVFLSWFERRIKSRDMS